MAIEQPVLHKIAGRVARGGLTTATVLAVELASEALTLASRLHRQAMCHQRMKLVFSGWCFAPLVWLFATGSLLFSSASGVTPAVVHGSSRILPGNQGNVIPANETFLGAQAAVDDSTLPVGAVPCPRRAFSVVSVYG